MRARAVLAIAAIVVLLGLAWLLWAALYRQRPQPASITSDRDANFLYGSIGNESDQGLPYWVAVVLPRVFGERYLPGPGGYAALLQWMRARASCGSPRSESASIASASTARCATRQITA